MSAASYSNLSFLPLPPEKRPESSASTVLMEEDHTSLETTPSLPSPAHTINPDHAYTYAFLGDVEKLSQALTMSKDLASDPAYFESRYGKDSILDNTMRQAQTQDDNHVRCVQLLLSSGANPNDKDFWGTPFLSNTIIWNTPIYLSLLLKHGADMNIKEEPGLRTPLMWAAELGRVKCLEILLCHLKDKRLLNEKDAYGHTALDYANFKKAKSEPHEQCAFLLRYKENQLDSNDAELAM
ncbi:MAG: ankyrin repeat domain-containing protein [Gammaproteobacteria bacterium]|nr:ankyrin repeat domain-containing protein [Gammaproteobacteria bacterium]